MSDAGTTKMASHCGQRTFRPAISSRMRNALWQLVHVSVIDIRRGPLCVQLSLDAEPHLLKLITGVFAVRPGPVDGIIAPARNDVPVTVIDRLTGGPAIVNDDVEASGTGGRSDGPAESRQERAYCPSERVRKIAYTLDGAFWGRAECGLC